MTGQPVNGPDGLEILETRVYYDPQSGQVKHVHTLAAPRGESLDAERIAEELAVVDNQLRGSLGEIDFIAVEYPELEGVEAIRVDVQRRALASDADSSS